MSPRQALAALTGRTPDADGPDELETWVGDLRPTAPTGGLSALATTDHLDAAAVRAATDTQETSK